MPDACEFVQPLPLPA